MTALQAIALILVAGAGTAVVATPDPRRQVFVSSLFGLSLAVLFLCFQAPDVALSQIVVGSVALPVMIVLALRRVREEERQRARERPEDG